MRMLLLASAGGAIGAGARYLVNVGFARAFGTAFPWATVCINISGSLLMGLLAGLLIGREAETAALRVFLATGVLGGFTTFSAFSLDFVVLMQRGETVAAFGYAAASVVVSIVALVLGLGMARLVAG